jgi:hypothetical protein
MKHVGLIVLLGAMPGVLAACSGAEEDPAGSPSPDPTGETATQTPESPDGTPSLLPETPAETPETPTQTPSPPEEIPTLPVSGTVTVAQAAGLIYQNSATTEQGLVASTAGDLDLDGHGDILVSDSLSDLGSADSGTIYVFQGPVTGAVDTGDAELRFVGDAESDQAGGAIEGGCDLNGDGSDDLVIGVPKNDASGVSAGAVYILFGPLEGSGEPIPLAGADVILRGEAGYSAGNSIACAGDVDADGHQDLVIGAFSADLPGGGSNHGVAYLVDGPVLPGEYLLEDVFDAQVMGAADSSTGESVHGVGDVDGDGYDDLLISTSYSGAGAYLFRGPLTGTYGLEDADTAFLATFEEPAALGDVDGDGNADLLFAVSVYEDGKKREGAQLFYGPLPPGEIDLEGELRADALFEVDEGSSSLRVNSGGDVNGDGLRDIVIGNPEHVEGADFYVGAVYLFYGSRERYAGQLAMADSADVTILGTAQAQYVGTRVHDGGDMNGDGADELLITASPSSSASVYEEVVYLFYGRPQSSPLAAPGPWGRREGRSPR